METEDLETEILEAEDIILITRKKEANTGAEETAIEETEKIQKADILEEGSAIAISEGQAGTGEDIKMYCRKCIKSDDKKVSMENDLVNQRYTCAECKHVVEWKHKDIL